MNNKIFWPQGGTNIKLIEYMWDFTVASMGALRPNNIHYMNFSLFYNLLSWIRILIIRRKYYNAFFEYYILILYQLCVNICIN